MSPEQQQQRYRVVEKLESGGMAEVFRAESEGLQGFKKQVAIKRVLPHLSEKKKFIAMFLDEARLSAQLSHSNCVQVFDIGVGDNAYFIVMEYVDGANLKAIAEGFKKQGKDFPVAGAAFIAHEICKGLAYAHEFRDPNGESLNIVHRDMSPPNVLLTKHGEIKIVDFGLAKASSQLEKSEPGIIKGKFSYLSPEAAMGQEVDARTDIFAVGIILWELLAGQRLFLGETDFQTVKKVQQAVVPPISQINTRVPKELERIVNRALAKDPAARYSTARELGQDLIRFLFQNGEPVGTFDVASLVQGTMRDRQRVRAPQGSIIDKLIEEALFEFTSLKEDATGPGNQPGHRSGAAASPLRPDQFVDPTNWANEIQIGDRSAPRHDPLALPGGIEAGNLSALEETDAIPHLAHAHAQIQAQQQMRSPTPLQPMQPMSQPLPTPPMPMQPQPMPHPSTAPPAHMQQPGAPVAIQNPGQKDKGRGGGGAVIGVMLFLVAALAAGAAYFAGFIPRR
jgi:serine/threonine-protein kinase